MIQLIIRAENSTELCRVLFDLVRVLSKPSDAPKQDAPKPDAPKPDAPKPDAPKPDAPKPDAPWQDTPKQDVQDPVNARAEMRALLAELLSGPKASKALALLRQYASTASKVPDDKVEALTAAFKEL